MKLIPLKMFRKIQKLIPILCVDSIMLNSKGEIYLKKRWHPPYKGKYSIVGGRIFRGESPIEALKRHITEESGLRIQKIKFINYIDWGFMGRCQYTFSLVFMVLVKGEPKEGRFFKDIPGTIDRASLKLIREI